MLGFDLGEACAGVAKSGMSISGGTLGSWCRALPCCALIWLFPAGEAGAQNTVDVQLNGGSADALQAGQSVLVDVLVQYTEVVEDSSVEIELLDRNELSLATTQLTATTAQTSDWDIEVLDVNPTVSATIDGATLSFEGFFPDAGVHGRVSFTARVDNAEEIRFRLDRAQLFNQLFGNLFVETPLGTIFDLVVNNTRMLAFVDDFPAAGGAGLSRPVAVEIAPGGDHLYVASDDADTLTAYARDPATGFLSDLQQLSGVEYNGLRALALSPDGRHLYGALRDANGIAILERDLGTGLLTPLPFVSNGDVHPGGTVAGLSGAAAIEVSDDGRFVYTCGLLDNAVSVFSRDSPTGALSFLQVVVDGVDGVDGLGSTFSMTLSDDDRQLYAAGTGDDAVAVFTRDSATGLLSFAQVIFDTAPVDGLNRARSVSVSPDGQHVYVAGESDHALAIFERDPATGLLSFLEAVQQGVDGITGLNQPYWVTQGPDGGVVFVAGAGSIAGFARDPFTGALEETQVIADGSDGVNRIANAFHARVSPDRNSLYVPGRSDNALTLFEIDSDRDGVDDGTDSCPVTPGSQADDGGVGSALADGIGNVCQCFDLDLDWSVTQSDVDLFRDYLAQLVPLSIQAQPRCAVIGPPDSCDLRTLVVASRAIAGLGPGIQPVCRQSGDQDGDGFTAAGGDCNDLVAEVFPGAPEICDGIDHDCDLRDAGADPNPPGCEVRYRDDDGDGFGAASLGCHCPGEGPDGALQPGDCNDDPAQEGHLAFPGALEFCEDPADRDCDGDPFNTGTPDLPGCIDFGLDRDGDTYSLPPPRPTRCYCQNSGGFAPYTGDPRNDFDCADADARAHPEATFFDTEVLDDQGMGIGFDFNCDSTEEKRWTSTEVCHAFSIPCEQGPEPGWVHCGGDPELGVFEILEVPSCGTVRAFVRHKRTGIEGELGVTLNQGCHNEFFCTRDCDNPDGGSSVRQQCR